MTSIPMSTLKYFSELSTKYTTWSLLKQWLQKEEPSIDIIQETAATPEGKDGRYAILRNSREKPTDSEGSDTFTSEASQMCRSVIWDTQNNVPCCISPFAAHRDQKTPMNVSLQVEDFVEGVMINIFHARGDKLAHVSTRSRIDADGSFYSERSFSELFEEAMDAKKTSLEEIQKIMGAPSDEVASTFMTLVMAHPEHRVVRSVDQANLWAIYRGTVSNDGTVSFYMDGIPVSWRPKSYSTNFVPTSWEDVKAKFEEVKASKPWYWQGLVIHRGLQRWRFRNGDHDRVRRNLRGTESNSFGRFLRLRANKRVQEYLRIYSEDNEVFQGFERDYRLATNTLYSWYCRCHKEHSVVFKSLPKTVQPLIFDLHKFYLSTLRPENKSLHLADVIQWIGEYLKSPYGIPNMIRFVKETEKPPASKTPWSDVKAVVGASAPVSPVVENCMEEV